MWDSWSIFILNGDQLDLPPELPLLVSVLDMLSLSIMAIANTAASSPPEHLLHALRILACISIRTGSGFSMPQRYPLLPPWSPDGSEVPDGKGGEGDGDGDGGEGDGEGPLVHCGEQLKQVAQQ
jgi:hypothetical protein